MRKYLLVGLVSACMHLVGSQQDPYVILSVDGGGIRGVIPAHIISLLEDSLGVKSADVFDSFAGTSTGGIIAIGLTIPDPKHPKKARYSAAEIEKLYAEEGQQIFNNSWSHWLTTLDGLIGPKYDNTALQDLLKKMMGNTTLDKVVKDLFVTSFDVTTHKQFLFENIDHKTLHNSALIDIALSTSAAPSYFSSHQVANQNLVDGGVLANNPAAWAYFEALKNSKIAENREVYVFSIGTGVFPEKADTDTEAGIIASIEPTINELFDGSGDTVEEAFNALAKKNKVHYIRWEPELATSSQAAMDNADPQNIKELQDIAETYFLEQYSAKEFAPLKAVLEKRAGKK